MLVDPEAYNERFKLQQVYLTILNKAQCDEMVDENQPVSRVVDEGGFAPENENGTCAGVSDLSVGRFACNVSLHYGIVIFIQLGLLQILWKKTFHL